jgi:hypothetical protein
MPSRSYMQLGVEEGQDLDKNCIANGVLLLAVG